MKIVVISDTHIGSRQSNVTIDDIEKIITSENPNLVVFNGDVIDLLVGKKSLEHLVDLKSRWFRTKTIFLDGNHDECYDEQRLFLRVDGKLIWISHGHEYENFLFRLIDPITVKINELFIRMFGINMQKNIREGLVVQYPEGRFTPHLYKQRQLAMKRFAIADIVVCGHTHYGEVTKVGDKIYANCGCYGSYIVIENGEVSLMRK